MSSHSAARASEISWVNIPVLDLRTRTIWLPAASISTSSATSSAPGGSMPTIFT